MANRKEVDDAEMGKRSDWEREYHGKGQKSRGRNGRR